VNAAAREILGLVHARYGDEQLVNPEAGTFYVERETAIALGFAWATRRYVKRQTTSSGSHKPSR
jgi:hypothetical protein